MIKEFYYEGVRDEMTSFLPKNYMKVLEIGCAKGGFRAHLKNDCEYWGIEPNQEVSKIATLKLNYVLTGTFDEVYNSLPNDFFDLVICNDVIEHMNDHHLFYKKIQKKCTTQCYIVGSLPNVRYIMNLYELLFSKNWKYREEGILDKTHLRFFTLKSIQEDFQLFNYEVEKLHGINPISFSKRTIYGLKMSFLQKVLGQDTLYLQFGFRIRLKS